MPITATEPKSDLGKYLLLAAMEDIFITKNGKVVAKLSDPHQDRAGIAKSLFGIFPAAFGFILTLPGAIALSAFWLPRLHG